MVGSVDRTRLVSSFRRRHGEQRPSVGCSQVVAKVERPLDQHAAFAAGRVEGGQLQVGGRSAGRPLRRQVRRHPLPPRPRAGDERVCAEEAEGDGQQCREDCLADHQRSVTVEGGRGAQRPAGSQQQQQRQSCETDTSQRAATTRSEVSAGNGRIIGNQMNGHSHLELAELRWKLQRSVV